MYVAPRGLRAMRGRRQSATLEPTAHQSRLQDSLRDTWATSFPSEFDDAPEARHGSPLAQMWGLGDDGTGQGLISDMSIPLHALRALPLPDAPMGAEPDVVRPGVSTWGPPPLPNAWKFAEEPNTRYINAPMIPWMGSMPGMYVAMHAQGDWSAAARSCFNS